MLEISDFGINPSFTSDDLSKISIIDDSLQYSDFFKSYLIPNKPCLINNITELWPCKKNWIKEKSINWDYFHNNLENVEVPISNCEVREYNVQKKSTMKLFDYIQYFKSSRSLTTNLNCFYLKDWHFVRDFPNEQIYRVPAYFASDWLNEYYDGNPELNDDYRFVYIGPKNSWTPFHADVFMSYSWSVNVFGRKKWILIPPYKEKYLMDNLGNLVYDVTTTDLSETELHALEVIQEEGQALFVPSSWHHQVWNLEETVSINHNWINGCNVQHVWNAMKKNLLEVKAEISDCKDMNDWPSQCQTILAATFGFNYQSFYSFLFHIAKKRIAALKESKSFSVFGDWSFGVNHIKFDLIQVLAVLNQLEKDEDFFLETMNSLNHSFEFLDSLNDFVQAGFR